MPGIPSDVDSAHAKSASIMKVPTLLPSICRTRQDKMLHGAKLPEPGVFGFEWPGMLDRIG